MPSIEHLSRGDDHERPAPPAVALARSVAAQAIARAYTPAPASASSPLPPWAAGDGSDPTTVDDLWDRLGDFA